jgi:lipoate-protein ligase B
MLTRDLGLLPYRDAWAIQVQAHADVLAGGPEQLLLVEHPPVITLGRRPGIAGNILASPEKLAALGVEVVQSDRGGDVTFHGQGQIVAYPIVRLIDHRLSVGAYVRRLQQAIIAALSDIGISARLAPPTVGVWADDADGRRGKIAAVGVRISRGVSLHGIAVNVSTDLRYFDLIVPCGLKGRGVTSVQAILGSRTPAMAHVTRVLSDRLAQIFPRL